MPLASNISALATRIATEFKTIRTELTGKVSKTGDETVNGVKTIPVGSSNSWIFNQPPQVAEGTATNHPVRRDDPRLTDARAPLTHSHSASDISSGNLSPLRLPQYLYPQTAATYSSGSAQTASIVVADFQYPAMFALTISGAGALTLNVPTGTPGNGMTYKLHIAASGGTRTFNFASGYRLSTGITSRSFSIPSGQVLMAAVEYSTTIGAWVIVAATVSAA